ncbi:MAG: hypothetical protein FGF48_08500 [Candidatus Brockarchaeota archaeon]|nr:hypothetical protein [Candidatus Brockarchaeota archaeon]
MWRTRLLSEILLKTLELGRLDGAWSKGEKPTNFVGSMALVNPLRN